MIQLYAAVGRYHIEVQPNGKKIPIVTVGIDRFDSVILTAPAVYYIMLFLIDVQV